MQIVLNSLSFGLCVSFVCSFVFSFFIDLLKFILSFSSFFLPLPLLLLHTNDVKIALAKKNHTEKICVAVDGIEWGETQGDVKTF